MRRLSIALAAIAGFAVGLVASWFIGVASTVSAECDGVCFDKLDEVGYISLAVGAACAMGAGLAARSLLRKR